MIRVLIADDHPLLRGGLVAMLASVDDVEVVADVDDPDVAVRVAAGLTPDVVLMDLQFAGRFRGAEATARLRALEEPPAVVVLTNYDSDGDILPAIEAGADGYLLKDATPEAILQALRDAVAGRPALTPSVATRLLGRMRGDGCTPSTREIEVLQLVANGLSNAQIATTLHVSEATVKSHLAHVFTKLDVSSRTAAVVTARERGLIRR